MKKLIYLGAVMALFNVLGCGGGAIKNKTEDRNSTALELPKAPVDSVRKTVISDTTIKEVKDLIGYWVGIFKPDTAVKVIYTGEVMAWDYSNKINISIDEIIGGKVKGHSVVAGTERPFSGTLDTTRSKFSFSVNEPGDDNHDGVFLFKGIMGGRSLTGTWKAYKKIHFSERRYTLYKKEFKYRPEVELDMERYVDWTKSKRITDDEMGEGWYDDSYFTTTDEVRKYNASSDELTREQVANMKKADLFILRNSIYARHGYSFKNQQLRAYFDRQNWYIPVSTEVKDAFTALEKKNLELLLRYEKNAKAYYDVFGRG